VQVRFFTSPIKNVPRGTLRKIIVTQFNPDTPKAGKQVVSTNRVFLPIKNIKPGNMVTKYRVFIYKRSEGKTVYPWFS